MANCLFLYVGDRLLHDGHLCEITQVNPDGVMVRDGAVSRYIFCTQLLDAKMQWCIEFRKDKYTGYSHTPVKEKAEKEKKFLESLGWTAKIYQTQVA